MKTYVFIVEQTDRYRMEHRIEANSKEEARAKLEEKLETEEEQEDDYSLSSNTFCGSEKEIL